MNRPTTTPLPGDLLDSLPYGVLVLDPDYQVEFVNSEAEQFLERSRDAVIGRNQWDLFPEAKGTVMDREYRRAFATGKRVQFRFFHSGRRSWFDFTAKTDHEKRLVVSIHDTTDLCRLEHALDSIEHQICESFSNAALGVAITDENGWFLEVNHAFSRITGYSAEELRRRDYLTITHPDDHEFHLKLKADSVNENCALVYEKRYVRKDGAVVWVRNNASVILRSERQKARYVVLCEDITEARLAEQKLRDSERRFRSLIERSLDLISILDRRGQILYESPASESLLGYTSEELVGRNASEFVHPEERDDWFAEFEKTVTQSTAPTRMIYRMRHKSGTWRYLEGAAANLLDDPAVRGIVVNSRDVTERIETQQRLKETLAKAEEATELKSRFLANMSHEIRTPMNGVVGLAELLDGTELNAEQAEYVEGIRYSADGLLRIIADILDFSKIEAGKLEIDYAPYDLHATLDHLAEVFAPQCRRKGLGFDLQIDATVPPAVIGDSFRVRQILSNLLSNAIKFTDTGRVILRAEYGRDTYKAPLCICVEDTGIGIAPEHHPRLFASFSQADSSTTRQYGGTGLGLAISKEIAELMEGQIYFESAQGRGSKFWLRLPIKNAGGLTAHSDQRENDQSANILVAEDNEVNQQIAKAILERAGFRVDTVSNGFEALSALVSRNYDLVVMDVQMPTMDGYAATAAIRKLDSALCRVPVLAMTANAMNGDREMCLKFGMNDYISKPVRGPEMLAKVRSLLSIASHC